MTGPPGAVLWVCCACALTACGACSAPESEPPSGATDCASALEPLGAGFGAPGPHAVRRERVPNPYRPALEADRPELEVSVFLPEGADPPVPLMVFGHANDVADPDHYAALIDHIVSRGFALIFSPYMVGSAVHADRYAALRAGVRAAVDVHRELLDLDRVGWIGHSYGAGALPHLARHARLEWGWGREGSFVHLLAPWFALDPGAGPAPPSLPEGVLLLVQVFEEDTANDHRIAIDLLRGLGVPPANRDYVLVRSDRWRDCELPAVHTVPQSRGLRALDDALDDRAVFRLFDALAAAAFEKDPQGRQIALGGGSSEQVEMGTWPDGTPLRPLVAGPDPEPAKPPSDYIFRQAEAEGWRRYGGEAD